MVGKSPGSPWIGKPRATQRSDGVAPGTVERIFDRFFRSNKARNTPGTGLGLSIVAHTINAHGGTVTADNQEGAGAKFIVVLPAAPPEKLAEYED